MFVMLISIITKRIVKLNFFQPPAWAGDCIYDPGIVPLNL